MARYLSCFIWFVGSVVYSFQITSVRQHISITSMVSSEAKPVEGIIPRVGGAMPEGRRPDWFHVPAPGVSDDYLSSYLILLYFT